MGRSKLVEFISSGLHDNMYSNMFWVNKGEGKFTLRLAMFRRNGLWKKDEQLLKDYVQVMKREYRSYSDARNGLRSALNGSDFLVRIDGNLLKGATYKFKRHAVTKVRSKTCDDETSKSVPYGVLGSTTANSTLQSHNDHSYANLNGFLDGNISPICDSSCVSLVDIHPMDFQDQSLNVIPDFDDAMECPQNDQFYKEVEHILSPCMPQPTVHKYVTDVFPELNEDVSAFNFTDCRCCKFA